MRSGRPGSERITDLAKLSSRSTSSRMMAMTLMLPSALRTVRRTSVPFLPRTSDTTSLMFMPVTTTGSSLPWATLRMMSLASSSFCFQAGPPGTMLITLVASFSVCRRAPMPSSLPDMEMSKLAFSAGSKYWVWGSKMPAMLLRYSPKYSVGLTFFIRSNHSS